MGWCSHNDVDLRPHIVPIQDVDWVTTLCKGCDSMIGRKIRLTDLVDDAIARQRAALNSLPDLEPDWEDDEG
jgi:hypothetical protein